MVMFSMCLFCLVSPHFSFRRGESDLIVLLECGQLIWWHDGTLAARLSAKAYPKLRPWHVWRTLAASFGPLLQCPEDIGARVRVWWAGNGTYFEGTIVGFRRIWGNSFPNEAKHMAIVESSELDKRPDGSRVVINRKVNDSGSKGLHTVRYDDGDVREYDLTTEVYEVLQRRRREVRPLPKAGASSIIDTQDASWSTRDGTESTYMDARRRHNHMLPAPEDLKQRENGSTSPVVCSAPRPPVENSTSWWATHAMYHRYLYNLLQTRGCADLATGNHQDEEGTEQKGEKENSNDQRHSTDGTILLECTKPGNLGAEIDGQAKLTSNQTSLGSPGNSAGTKALQLCHSKRLREQPHPWDLTHDVDDDPKVQRDIVNEYIELCLLLATRDAQLVVHRSTGSYVEAKKKKKYSEVKELQSKERGLRHGALHDRTVMQHTAVSEALRLDGVQCLGNPEGALASDTLSGRIGRRIYSLSIGHAATEERRKDSTVRAKRSLFSAAEQPHFPSVGTGKQEYIPCNETETESKEMLNFKTWLFHVIGHADHHYGIITFDSRAPRISAAAVPQNSKNSGRRSQHINIFVFDWWFQCTSSDAPSHRSTGKYVDFIPPSRLVASLGEFAFMTKELRTIGASGDSSPSQLLLDSETVRRKGGEEASISWGLPISSTPAPLHFPPSPAPPSTSESSAMLSLPYFSSGYRSAWGRPQLSVAQQVGSLTATEIQNAWVVVQATMGGPSVLASCHINRSPSFYVAAVDAAIGMGKFSSHRSLESTAASGSFCDDVCGDQERSSKLCCDRFQLALCCVRYGYWDGLMSICHMWVSGNQRSSSSLWKEEEERRRKPRDVIGNSCKTSKDKEASVAIETGFVQEREKAWLLWCVSDGGGCNVCVSDINIVWTYEFLRVLALKAVCDECGCSGGRGYENEEWGIWNNDDKKINGWRVWNWGEGKQTLALDLMMSLANVLGSSEEESEAVPSKARRCHFFPLPGKSIHSSSGGYVEVASVVSDDRLLAGLVVDLAAAISESRHSREDTHEKDGNGGCMILNRVLVSSVINAIGPVRAVNIFCATASKLLKCCGGRATPAAASAGGAASALQPVEHFGGANNEIDASKLNFITSFLQTTEGVGICHWGPLVR